MPKILTKYQDPSKLTYTAIADRKITAAICAKYEYYVDESGNHLINVRDSQGVLLGQKLRTKNKEFVIYGTISYQLIGQQTHTNSKSVLITEGELDMLSYATAFQSVKRNVTVVSLPNGVSSAPRTITNCSHFLKKFSTIYLSFDEDDQGQKAAKAVSKLLSLRDVKVVRLPAKDASATLTDDRYGVKTLLTCVDKAERIRPEGVIYVRDVKAQALAPKEAGLKWFDDRLTRCTGGRHYGDVILIGAGTGTGKTDFLTQQIAYDIDKLKLQTAVFYMEMSAPEVVQRIAGKIDQKPYHDDSILVWTKEDLSKALDKLDDCDLCALWDVFGVVDWQKIEEGIYYHISCGTRLFYIDHLTALATGSDKEERKVLEQVMAHLSSIAIAHQVIFHVISHLTAPLMGSHENGANVEIRHFKGSRAIGYWAHTMFGLERDQQAIDIDKRNTLRVRILKHRFRGSAVGNTFPFTFHHTNNVLYPTSVY